MAVTAAEVDDLRRYVLDRACTEFRRGEPCVERGDSRMVGDMHAGCFKVPVMLSIVDRIPIATP